jgi:hypothetical protein
VALAGYRLAQLLDSIYASSGVKIAPAVKHALRGAAQQ